MCKKFMAWARRVSSLAREAAEQCRRAYLASEHILLARLKSREEDDAHGCTAGGQTDRAAPHGAAPHLIILVVMLGMLVIAGCYDGYDDGNEGATHQPPQQLSSSLAVSFVVDVQPILTQQCATAGCHNAVTQAAGLNLEAGVAFDNIVQVPSRQVSSQDYIEPDDPNSSYLFRKITGAPGILGTRMPQNNPTFFDQNPDLLALVRRWIQEGAQNLSVSFAVDVQPILTQQCATAGCHNTVTQAAGLNLEAGVAFDNIVQVPSRQVPSHDYIEPGDPDSSYLFRKITGAPDILGTRMPRDNPTFFDQNPDLLALVRRWIQEGANEGAAHQPPQQPPPQPSPSPTVSFAADVQPILTQQCTTAGCHNAVTQAAGLNLEAGVAFDNIVQVPSRQMPSQDYIEPGGPDSSYLFRKITGATGILGLRMPQNNPTFFDQNPDLLALVRQWIEDGAIEN